MRTLNIVAGGSVLGILGIGGALFLGFSPSQAQQSANSTLQLTGQVRDFQASPAHPDFQVTPGDGYGPYSGNVAMTLDSDGKPVFTGNGKRVKKNWRDSQNRQISHCVYNANYPWNDSAGTWGAADHGAITSAATFAQWFRDVPGVNMSRLWKITMTWQNAPQFGPCWVYDTNDFNPIDNQLQGNGNDQHNFHFTYEIRMKFTYDYAAGQFVWFKGDDDCWVFVDGKLAMDHGGIAGSRELYVDLRRPCFALTNGQEYTLHFFLAERHQPQSQFHLKTNIADLHTYGTDAVLSAYD